jgi:hypothetical protein
MTLVLHKQHAHDRIGGEEPPRDWCDDDYAVVDERLVGRISTGSKCKVTPNGSGFCRRCRPRCQTKALLTGWRKRRRR